MYHYLAGKKILITGGTGSLGRTLVHRLLRYSDAEQIIVFSRDEAKQYDMRTKYFFCSSPTEDVIYQDYARRLKFIIGDVRNYNSVRAAVHNADIIINAAAMKQVPTCEYFPYEAVKTNITGAENIVMAVKECGGAKLVVGISTDKAVKPINVMGMTKAIQERIFIEGNIRAPKSTFICTRYGNVIASRGSAIPLFMKQIASGGPITITTFEMTRFLLSLEAVVDTILFAIHNANAGEVIVPVLPSAKIVDVAKAMSEGKNIEIKEIGVRPGEKIHEILISIEEIHRTRKASEHYYAIKPMLGELCVQVDENILTEEYSSANHIMDIDKIKDLLRNESIIDS